MKFWNFLKESGTESSVRLVFIITAVSVLTGLLIIDIKFAFNIAKYSGTEISLVIAANSAFLISVIYGKNKAKQIETTYDTEEPQQPNQSNQLTEIKDPTLPL
jgi:hypothetical protein